MFTLRKITGSSQAEMNFYLGRNYTLITKDRNPNDFKEACEKMQYDEKKDNVYGFVSDEEGESFALFSNQRNYIMTSGGKTYDNISD